MTVSQLLARIEGVFRPEVIRLLPARWNVAFYSWARQIALQLVSADHCQLQDVPASSVECWGVRFRTPLFNAAGMFKHGEGYELAYRQGAGAYIAGTTTGLPRIGNVRHGIAMPFVPYPRSRAASNWLGLPNPGHRAVAARISQYPRYDDFPIGASVALDPEEPFETALELLIEGMHLYDKAGVDFIELNESCPNTVRDTHGYDALLRRFHYVAEHFLLVRSRNLPVVVKLSVDTDPALIVKIVPVLAQVGFDGITLGNTSTLYVQRRSMIVQAERRVFDYFTRTFGGGISGEPLRSDVVTLVRSAKEVASKLGRTFHIIAVGGIATGMHLKEVLEAGASLAQWYTGYFERFVQSGHSLYRTIFEELQHYRK